MAIDDFRLNLEKFRKIYPVKTICMHGSPLSEWDNRLIWEKYDYRDFGITAEPYFDVDFKEVLYLTDTGRRWDGDAFNIRDKIGEESGIGKEELGVKSNSGIQGLRNLGIKSKANLGIEGFRDSSDCGNRKEELGNGKEELGTWN